jgi:hypothetical protein
MGLFCVFGGYFFFTPGDTSMNVGENHLHFTSSHMVFKKLKKKKKNPHEHGVKTTFISPPPISSLKD